MPSLSVEPDMVPLLQYVDANNDKYIEELAEFIEIPSVSGVFEYRHDMTTMIKLVEKWLKKLKIKYECFDIGWQEMDELCCKRPNAILATLGTCRKKRTLCIYAHLDVTDPKGQDWTTCPFKVTVKDKKLYGKGVAFGKGPLISWFHAIQAYQKHGLEVPVNVKFIIDSQNELGNAGIEELLRLKPKFLANIDYIVICDSEWLGNKYPCIVYGTAGRCRFEVTVEKNGDSDPKEDVKNIFDKLVDEENRVIIPHFADYVEQITPAEELLYDSIDFDFESIRITLPANKKHWDKIQMLMSFWRLPDVAVGDILECTCEKSGDKENVKVKVKRHLTLKIVPKQMPDVMADLVSAYVMHTCNDLKCQSKVECELVYAARPWLVDFNHPNYEAARRATLQIYKEQPNLIREDKEIPILLLLFRVIQERNILLLPLPNNACNARRANENITLKNFFEGTKLLIAYLYQLSYTN